MPRYIQVNHLKQTLREDLRIAHSWKVIFLWIPKLLRRRSEFTNCVPIPLPFQDFVVAAESISPEATAGLAQPLAEAARLGFVAPVYQVIRTLAGESVTTAANCRHSGGEVLGRLMHLRVGIVHPPKEKTIFGLISQLSDGRRLVTSSGRASFDARPTIIVQRQVGGSLEELLILHQAKLEELRSDTQPERLLDDAALYARLATQGRERMLEPYTQEQIAKQMYGVYEEMMSERV